MTSQGNPEAARPLPGDPSGASGMSGEPVEREQRARTGPARLRLRMTARRLLVRIGRVDHARRSGDVAGDVAVKIPKLMTRYWSDISADPDPSRDFLASGIGDLPGLDRLR
jgi:hypothetical protein